MAIDFLEKYIDAAVDSSTRARQVLVVMITASILIFGAFWNSRAGGWIPARIDCIKAARDFREGGEPKGKDCADNYSISTPADADRMIADLHQVVLDRVITVRVPFFGVAFDVNDLGMFSGFTFLVIMLWLRFCLWHELRNNQRVFRATPREQRSEVYRLLAMRQVLTVPPLLRGESGHEAIWSWAVRILFCLPIAVQTTVLINDIETRQRGMVISEFNVIFGLTASAIFTLAILVLTALSISLSEDNNREWHKIAKEVQQSPSVGGGQPR